MEKVMCQATSIISLLHAQSYAGYLRPLRTFSWSWPFTTLLSRRTGSIVLSTAIVVQHSNGCRTARMMVSEPHGDATQIMTWKRRLNSAWAVFPSTSSGDGYEVTPADEKRLTTSHGRKSLMKMRMTWPQQHGSSAFSQ